MSDTEFSGDIALGIRGRPSGAKTTWTVLSFHEGVCEALPDPVVLDSDEVAEEHLPVLMALSTDQDVWDRIYADPRTLVEAIANQDFEVTAEGRAAFFVRHMASVLEAVRGFSAMASR